MVYFQNKETLFQDLNHCRIQESPLKQVKDFFTMYLYSMHKLLNCAFDLRHSGQMEKWRKCVRSTEKYKIFITRYEAHLFFFDVVPPYFYISYLILTVNNKIWDLRFCDHNLKYKFQVLIKWESISFDNHNLICVDQI